MEQTEIMIVNAVQPSTKKIQNKPVKHAYPLAKTVLLFKSVQVTFLIIFFKNLYFF